MKSLLDHIKVLQSHMSELGFELVSFNLDTNTQMAHRVGFKNPIIHDDEKMGGSCLFHCYDTAFGEAEFLKIAEDAFLSEFLGIIVTNISFGRLSFDNGGECIVDFALNSPSLVWEEL